MRWVYTEPTILRCNADMSKVNFKSTSLLSSLFVHCLLIAIMAVAFVPERYRVPGPVDPKAVIQVSAIDAKVLQHQARMQHQAEVRQRQQQREKLQRQKKVLAFKKAQHLARQRRAALLKKHKQQLRLQQHQAALQKKKLHQLKLHRERQAKIKQQLLAKSQQLARSLMAERLKAETAQVEASAARQQQGIINRYVPQILAAISQRWLLPAGTDPHLQCVFQVQLAPGGVVMNVHLVSSSGNLSLDRAAKQAIWSASPLPVPKNPALFDKLRTLRLTMRPETAVLR